MAGHFSLYNVVRSEPSRAWLDQLSMTNSLSPGWALLTLALLLGACGTESRQVDVEFDARFDGDPVACRPSAEGWALTDLRFFVHDIVLRTEQGRSAPLKLADDDVWQDSSVALLDFEDGTGACLNGTTATNTVVRGEVALPENDAIVGLSFRIGVPETVNHANPMTADAPLAYTIMHWHWRSGYKFMRAGVESPNDFAWLHLGSSRCAGTIGNIQGCASGNRPLVTVDGMQLSGDRVVIDIARLLGPVLQGDGNPWSCESGPDEDHCRVVFSELGIEFDSGRTLGPSPAFYAAPR